MLVAQDKFPDMLVLWKIEQMTNIVPNVRTVHPTFDFPWLRTAKNNIAENHPTVSVFNDTFFEKLFWDACEKELMIYNEERH